MRLGHAFFLVGALAFAVSASGQTPVEAGSYERVTGSATVTVGSETRSLRNADVVREGDLITTEAGAEVLVRFRDGATVITRASSQMLIAEFKYDQQPTDSFVLRLLKGGARKASGILARARPGNFRFVTPTATVGIRGTDFEVAIIEEDTADRRAGTYDYVHEGVTILQIASGDSLEVRAEQTGLALANPQPGEAVLQILRERPAFLRGGGFDALIQQINRPPMIIPRMR